MTTNKELFGKYVQNVTTDPTSTDAEGQIWYNATSARLRRRLVLLVHGQRVVV